LAASQEGLSYMKLVNESRLHKFFQLVVVVVVVYNRYIIIYIVSLYNTFKAYIYIYILVNTKTYSFKDTHAPEGLTHTM
jgi:hypothetical protein